MLRNFLLIFSICFAVVIGNCAESPDAEQEELVSQETLSAAPVSSEDIVFEQAVEAVEVAPEVASTNVSKPMTKYEKAENLKSNDEHGFVITIMAMVIVIFALAVLYVLFLGFGKVSSHLQAKKKLAAQGKTKNNLPMEKQDLDSGEVIAAISMALAQHFDAHDIEENVLTMKRMKRAYSPWNSKIYNMREVPMLRKNFK